MRRPARRAVATIAEGLGVDITEAAQAIIDIANENMHAALRVVSIERGFDPREFGLLAFGGAGPMHANALGRLIHADPVVIPATPGVLSAFGFLVSEVQNEFARTYLQIAEETPAENLRGGPDRAALGGHELARARGCADRPARVQLLRRLPLLHAGHSDSVRRRPRRDQQRLRRGGPRPLRSGTSPPLRLRARRSDRDRHRARGRCRATAPRTARRRRRPRSPRPRSPTATRMCSSTASGTRPRSTTVSALQPGQSVAGPAIAVQQDTTTVIEPGYVGTIDGYGNIIIRKLEGN